MKLHQLPKTTSKTSKRLGRGYGSGVGGHTATRGTKGQKARSKVSTWFEGGQLPLSKRLPFLRGKDRFKVINNAPVTVNVYQLQVFEKNAVVDKHSLVSFGLITQKEALERPIKILGSGELSVALKIDSRILTSASALDKIKKAGGTIEETKKD